MLIFPSPSVDLSVHTASSSFPQTICIGSAKGGVGKTAVAANLAVALQRMGKRVMLLDADLQMPTVHMVLGTHCVYNLGHFLSGKKTLQEIVTTSPTGVRLVSGVSGLSKLSQRHVFSIVQGFCTLTEEVDFLIVDTATGITPLTLPFLTASPKRFLVVRDNPQSIVQTIACIEALVHEHGHNEIYLLINGLDDPQEGQLVFDRINQACALTIGQSINYIGAIGQHENILSALKKCKSVFDYASQSGAAYDFSALAQATDQLLPIGYTSGKLEFFIEQRVRRTH
jgi:flagellar biosynthesis protein FlhG